MSSKNIFDVVDIMESLTDGLKLDIKGIAFGTDKTGQFVVIETTDGKKFRTYSGVILDILRKVEAKKFDFKKDVLKAQVKEVETQDDSGNTYFTLVGQKA